MNKIFQQLSLWSIQRTTFKELPQQTMLLSSSWLPPLPTKKGTAAASTREYMEALRGWGTSL